VFNPTGETSYNLKKHGGEKGERKSEYIYYVLVGGGGGDLAIVLLMQGKGGVNYSSVHFILAQPRFWERKKGKGGICWPISMRG